MVKRLNVSQIIIKMLLSAAILQLMLICFVLTPPTGCDVLVATSLKAYVPEMVEYAVLTAMLSIPAGVGAEKLLKKL